MKIRKNTKQNGKLNPEPSTLLNNPRFYKGTAFSKRERQISNLTGRLPFKVETLDNRVKRAYKQFKDCESTREKRLFLNRLQDLDEVLFYKLSSLHLEEIIPLIYTPHVADDCLRFSSEFHKSHGGYISYPDRKNMKEIINNLVTNDTKIIVVTDGERVLGIGDQGIGGIKIAMGKLMLYSLLGGINPKTTLPIVLDVGTNNKDLLSDPMYLGWRHSRLTGKKYSNFVDSFIDELKKRLPNVLLQWEDFGKNNAWHNLNRYRKKICSFNDDIQGTATITLATLLASIKASKQQLLNQNIVILGAGSAGIGIVTALLDYTKYKGISTSKLHQQIWLVDKNGLLTDKTENILEIQKPYIHKTSDIKKWDIKNAKNITLLEVIKNVKPTILIGCSTIGGAFNKDIIKEIAKHTKRPIILPLSNPTKNSEATPKDIIKWTDGKALVATGSPFDPVVYKNQKYTISQCNNALAFPGIGLGIIASRAKLVTNEMFFVAAEVIYKNSPALKNPQAPLLPYLKNIPKISKDIAKKIAEVSLKNKKADVSKKIKKIFWKPKYEKIMR